jgi:flagellar hook-associated protein 3 FlgL
VVDAINATGVFTARLDDKLDDQNDGTGFVELSTTATTAGGSGEDLDRASGLRIVNGDQTHILDISSAETIEELLNILNGSSAAVLATINEAGNGIDIRSRSSGTDFMIGENGGTTASQLGIRTLTGDTLLADLNYGQGVEWHDSVDFTIQRRDGVALDIDISNAATVADVIDLINNHPANVGNVVTARLAQFGNGIELVDANAGGTQDLTIVRTNGFAAWYLGLVPWNQDESVAAPPPVGQPQVLTGSDVRPLETPGVFNSLLRLSSAIEEFDLGRIERAAALLDQSFFELNFVRAELGGKAPARRRLRTIRPPGQHASHPATARPIRTHDDTQLPLMLYCSRSLLPLLLLTPCFNFGLALGSKRNS